VIGDKRFVVPCNHGSSIYEPGKCSGINSCPETENPIVNDVSGDIIHIFTKHEDNNPDYDIVTMPNTSIATSIVHNYSMPNPRVRIQIPVWIFLCCRYCTGLMGSSGNTLLILLADMRWKKMGAAEVEKHRITVQQRERHFLGSPATEIIIIKAAVIIVALALILADQDA